MHEIISELSENSNDDGNDKQDQKRIVYNLKQQFKQSDEYYAKDKL